MSELKLIELLMTQPFLYIGFGVLVWLLTYVVKRPIKKYTAKIRDEKTRKLANKWILLIPFALALICIIVYNGIFAKLWFYDWETMLSEAFSVAMLSIVIYNVFQDLRGKKSEYETTEDGRHVFNLLLVFAKDRSKVKMLLDQCKENYEKGFYSISDTVKAWLPENVDQDVVNTVVKVIKGYFDNRKKDLEDFIDEAIL